MSQHVLVVDDSATIRRVVARTLERAGYRVSTAADGREALELAQRDGPPDLILLDFLMPHMNGFQLCQAMSRIANLANVPLVLMSAKADRIGDAFVAQTGALDCITKPFPPEAILAVTAQALIRVSEEVRDTLPPPSPAPDSEETARPIRLSEPPGDESPAKLREAAQRIAERLGRLVANGEDAERVAAEVLDRVETAELFDAVDELHRLVPGREGDAAFEGRLEHVALGEVLQLLQHQRQTGVLEIERGERAVTVCMREGAVQLALGRVESHEFRLGRFLVREELIAREDLDRILKQRQKSGSLLGAQLVKLGYLSMEDLQRVLVLQTSELIYEALRWSRGRFRFVRFASRPEARDAQLGLPVAAVLMEGLRRVDEWRLIEEQIKSFDDVPRKDEEALRGVGIDRLAPEERRVLELVDGLRTIRALVLEARMGSFELCRIVFSLATSRLVRLTPPTVGTPAPDASVPDG